MGARRSFMYRWDKGERIISQTLMAGSAALVIVEVLGRYALHFSLYWVEEYTRYLLIGAVLTGASTLVRTDGHVAVSLLYGKVSLPRKAILDIIYALFGIFVSAVILIGGIDMVVDAWEGGFESEPLVRTPLWIPYLLVVLGGALMTASWFWKLFQTKDLSWRSLKDRFTYLMILVAAFGVFLFFGVHNVAITLFIGLLWFVGMGVPIAFALGLVGALAVIGLNLGPSIVVASKGFWQMNSFTLLAIPFFTLAASAMVNSRLGKDVFEFAIAAIGHIRGGLGVAVALASAMFAAMSGSTVANAAALAAISFPMLVARGYPPALAAGLIGAGGTLAPMIPPSGHMVLYGAITQQSVGDLLMAGIIPGLMIAAGLAAYTYIASVRGGYDKSEGRFSLSKFSAAFRKCIWAVLMPVIILGSIYAGIASPTEAAAIAALYGFLVTLLVYRTLNRSTVSQILQGTVDITAMIFLIIMFSGVFGFVLAEQQLPKAFTDAVIGANIKGWEFMMITIFLIFILGFFMGSAAITLIVTPILMPLLIAYHYNLVHFGVIQTAILETSFLTPPVGTVLYIIARVCKLKLEEVMRGVWPFIIIIYLVTILVAFVPGLALFLTKGR
ncbi:MAG: hypothetical protein A2162_12095 [Deltaproteobacteria bacterium RBG_13_52_11b]|nr:MAG: hypothetical protein A2162_12095 [Deltaproteobacteria bacterium RBG_13_52_11b]